MSLPEPLTAEAALTLLREVVAEKPDFVYEPVQIDIGDVARCLYVRNGQPSCVIGQMLHRAGWPIGIIGQYERRAIGAFPETIVTHKAAYLLSGAQGIQDSGLPWSAALAAAEGRYRGSQDLPEDMEFGSAY